MTFQPLKVGDFSTVDDTRRGTNNSFVFLVTITVKLGRPPLFVEASSFCQTLGQTRFRRVGEGNHVADADL